jgi:hypothetical protein
MEVGIRFRIHAYSGRMRVLGIVVSMCLVVPSGMAAEPARAARAVPMAQAMPGTPPTAQPLTEAEAKELEQRDEKPGKDVAGGALTNLQLTYIVIALAAAVIVLIAVQ